MKRKFDSVADGPKAPAAQPMPRSDPRVAPSSHPPVKQRKAVPPGYLHDLMHTRHLMNSFGLRGSHPAPPGPRPLEAAGPSKGRSGLGPTALPTSKLQMRKGLPYVPANTLPFLLAQRKKFLRGKKQQQGGCTQYQQRPDEPVGLLSMPEDVMLKIVCYLNHDEIKPLFQTCKPLRHTLREAIRFHFNFATPMAEARGALAPNARRPPRKRAVTALADVLAHLKRGPRQAAVAMPEAPGSTHSTTPRALRFPTPGATPAH